MSHGKRCTQTSIFGTDDVVTLTFSLVAKEPGPRDVTCHRMPLKDSNCRLLFNTTIATNIPLLLAEHTHAMQKCYKIDKVSWSLAPCGVGDTFQSCSPEDHIHLHRRRRLATLARTITSFEGFFSQARLPFTPVDPARWTTRHCTIHLSVVTISIFSKVFISSLFRIVVMGCFSSCIPYHVVPSYCDVSTGIERQ